MSANLSFLSFLPPSVCVCLSVFLFLLESPRAVVSLPPAHQPLSPSGYFPLGSPSFGVLIKPSRATDLLLLGVVVASYISNFWAASLTPVWLHKSFYKFIALNSHCWKDLKCFLVSWQETIRFKQLPVAWEHMSIQTGSYNMKQSMPGHPSNPFSVLPNTLLDSISQPCNGLLENSIWIKCMPGISRPDLLKSFFSLSSPFCWMDFKIQCNSGSWCWGGQSLLLPGPLRLCGADPSHTKHCQLDLRWVRDKLLSRVAHRGLGICRL